MQEYMIKSPRKLIETALPLDDINTASAREKSIRHGHPSTLHLWWARRPLAAARAVIFSQMVNDPSWRFEMEGKTPTAQEKAAITKKRKQLFEIIKKLVLWENTTNEAVLEEARAEIRKSWTETCEINKDHPLAASLFNPDVLPSFHDPFAGGGAIPLEAQRLGLESYASDLNPVPVMINKAMIEFPPRFANMPPVHPKDENDFTTGIANNYKGSAGLAEDIAYYGKWMRDEAFKKIGGLYPKVKITQEIINERPDLEFYLGKELTVIAYIWARTVKSPNPAFNDCDVPLASSFVLSKKKSKEAWIEPVVHGKEYGFKVHTGKYPKDAENGTKATGRNGFKCLMSGTVIPFEYIREQGAKGKLGSRLMSVICEGEGGRVYLSPECTQMPEIPEPSWKPETETYGKSRANAGLYGLTTWSSLFTKRQLVALSTFCDLIPLVAEKVQKDWHTGDDNCHPEHDGCHPELVSGSSDGRGLADGGHGAKAYAEAIAVYLSFAIDKCADYWSGVCTWHNSGEKIRNTFGRQAIPMAWDYAETNPFSFSTGNWMAMVDWLWKVLLTLPQSNVFGNVDQDDAQSQKISQNKVVSTDPPYYDNIEYADLSDFFYVWLRHNLRDVFPNLFATMATPKDDELVASSFRHESKKSAEEFFLHGMTDAMKNLCSTSHAAFPLTIYYAFKQSELESDGITSAGWETFLQALINSGFAITGTWPVRTELQNRSIAMGANALASSIVLVCRRRSDSAVQISRREFLRELKKVMDTAKEMMTQGDENTSPVAPVDLSQAIIGPGMAVFSKYKSVLEADGSAMSVKEALKLINRYMEEDDYDSGTLFCKEWFLQYGWQAGSYGEADVLSRAKNANLQILQSNDTIKSGQGKVQLTKWQDYKDIDNMLAVPDLSTWNLLHQCIFELNKHGTQGAAKVYAIYKEKSADIRSLAYTMYTLCERGDNAEDARFYNELIIAWDDIEIASENIAINVQGKLF